MGPQAGKCQSISPDEEPQAGGKVMGALAQSVLLQSPGLCFNPPLQTGSRRVPMGRDVNGLLGQSWLLVLGA